MRQGGRAANAADGGPASVCHVSLSADGITAQPPTRLLLT